jgi:gliding motility-associated-like protein
MKKYFLGIFIIFFILKNISQAQVNLVPNSGFESVECVSQKVNEWGPRGGFTPFNECFPLGFSPGGNLKPPFINPNPWTYSVEHQYAKSGVGFVGIEVSNSRGYLLAKLKEELKQYKTYFARFYVMPYYPIYDWIKWPYTDAIGMYVTPFDNSIGAGSNFPYSGERPVIENRGKVIKDTLNWTRVSGSFNARGQEQYVVIANFRNNADTKIELNGRIPPTGGYATNMFFIDDVVISEFDPLPDTAILCANAPLVFDATFYDATYRWSDFSENNNLVVTKPGSYWVQATIDGVLLQDEVIVVAEKEFKPLPKDTIVCDRGPSVNLSITTKAQYKWSTGQTSKSIAVNTAGRYTVTVTTPQCTLQFSTDVKARDCFCDFYSPTVFSPNGDGENETFKPYINCKVIYVKDYKLSIFNRFGNLVFRTNDINEAWDGTYKGQPCSQDIYAWVVEYNTLIDKDLPYRKVTESGDIAILR